MKQRLIRLLKDLGVGILIALVYFISAKIGLQFAFFDPSATPVWPPTGIAIAALILFGYRFWPAVFIGAFFANADISSPISALGIGIGNVLEAFFGAYLTNKFANGKQAFDTTFGILKFVFFVAILSTTISASIGVSSLLLTGSTNASTALDVWLTWWLGDAVGALLITPLIILLWKKERKLSMKEIGEFIVLIAVLLLFGSVVFGGLLPGDANNFPLQFIILPILIWVAFRFRQKETAIVSVILASVTLVGTLNQYGPFAIGSKNISLLLAQGYVGIFGTTSLVIAALVAQLRKAQQSALHSLQEKETLLKEIHHRVKNNMQIIQSLLSLQSQKLRSKKMLAPFKESQRRIRSMALVHQNLYESEKISEVRFDQYMKNLVEMLFESFGTNKKKIEVSIKSLVTMDMDSAVACGLIINELITNSLKYAFPKGEGKINIKCFSRGKNMILIVEDNGVGMPSKFDWQNSQSLGLRLVRMLSDQLHGSVSLHRNKGTRFTITFPKKIQA